jgi:hypothetical protein
MICFMEDEKQSGRKPEMDQDREDDATIAVLMERFKDYRLPRARRLLERMREGEKLTGYDIQWLKTIYADGVRTRPLVERHPEYSNLIAQAMDLYTEIITLGLENEQNK